MREIKFRAWDFLNKQWFGVSKIVLENGVYVGCEDLTGTLYAQVGLVQYTGLKDSTGVEIYEGDLLMNVSGRIAEVVWHEYTGQWDTIARNGIGVPDELSPFDWRHTKVIGNIYENPEYGEN